MVWRWIPGYRGYYKASDRGLIKSVERLVVTNLGHRRLYRSYILRPGKAGQSGYCTVALSKKGKVRRYYVHDLVLRTFVGPCPEGMVCRHFPDKDITNNALTNIQWGTPKQNAHDKIIHGTHLSGENTPSAKLSDAAVRLIRKQYQKVRPTVTSKRQACLRIANFHHVHEVTVKRIVEKTSRSV